jgi:U3 small nucleolar RNA-associated protein 14
LAVVDPDEYQKVMEDKEMDRIRERLTLKHSNASKWAKRTVRQKDLQSKQVRT